MSTAGTGATRTVWQPPQGVGRTAIAKHCHLLGYQDDHAANAFGWMVDARHTGCQDQAPQGKTGARFTR